MTTLGTVLAGGASKRMGEDKALVHVAGSTMLDRVANAVEKVCGEVVVLGRPYEGHEHWIDEVDVSGPLAGIATALSRTSNDRVLMVAVDHPFVRSETLSGLVAVESDLSVVPVDDEGVRQVTCAVYPAAIAAMAVEEAEGGGSIQSLLDRVSFEPVPPDTWRAWGEDGRSWFSADSPEALREGVARYLA